MTMPANIRVNVRTPFPSQVSGSGAVTINKRNGIWSVGIPFDRLAVNTPAPDTDFIIVYDTASNDYFRLPVSALMTGGGGVAPIGFGVNAEGLAGNSPVFSLLNGGALADIDRMYLVNMYSIVTTIDPAGFGSAVLFKLNWTDAGGPATITFSGNYVHGDFVTDFGATFDVVGKNDWQAISIRGLAGSDITAQAIIDGVPLTGGKYAARIRTMKLE